MELCLCFGDPDRGEIENRKCDVERVSRIGKAEKLLRTGDDIRHCVLAIDDDRRV